MRFSNSGSTASGVTSRPVKPVPPVVMITSTSGSSIHLLHHRADLALVVGNDLAVGELVTGRRDAVGKRRAGAVFVQRPRVGHGEHGEADGHEGLVGVGVA